MAFILGILAADLLLPEPSGPFMYVVVLLAVSAGFVALTLLLRRIRPGFRRLLFGCSFAALGAAAWASALAPASPRHVLWRASEYSSGVVGTVVRENAWASRSGRSTAVVLSEGVADSMGRLVPCEGLLGARIPEGVTVDVGGRYRFDGAPKPLSRRGDRGWRSRLLLSTGVLVSVDAGRVVPLGRGELPLLWEWSDRLQSRFSLLIRRLVGGEEGALLAAMLVGDRLVLSPASRAQFTETGVGHVLAISGLHVGLVLWFVWEAGRFACLTLRPRALLGICVAVSYALVAGGRPSVVRAAVMVCCYLAAGALGRSPDAASALGLSAIIVLARRPLQLFEPGFQLSFIAVAALVFGSPVLRWHAAPSGPPLLSSAEERRNWSILFPDPPRHSRRRRFTASTIVPLVLVQVALVPVIARHFGQVHPLALPLNIIIVPVMGVVLLLGLLTLALGLIWEPAGMVFGGSAWLLLRILRFLFGLAHRLPFAAIEVARPSIFFLVVWYVGMAVALLMLASVEEPLLPRVPWELQPVWARRRWRRGRDVEKAG